MIHYTQGNLLDAEVEALVNTVNTMGIMGKGIALMFKEAFPENFRLYAAACKRGERTLYVSFDEGAAQIVRNLRSVNIHLAPHLKSGLLTMYSTRTRGPNVEAIQPL
jgi:O-acetyl-ADP-ribose deacetylase (regulator of RNase III)